MQNKNTAKSTKAQPAKPAQKATAQKATAQKAQPKQQQKPQQQQQQQQAPQEQQQKQHTEPKMEISQTIKLTQMLQVFDQNKEEKKASFIIDDQGNANTFFKYKGEVIDLTEYVIKEQTQGAKHEDNVEHARRMIVMALKAGGLLCFHCDLFSTNFSNYFQGAAWWQPENLFNYDILEDEKYHKKEILKPEEDVDVFGNKGCFMAKTQDFRIAVLLTTKENPGAEEALEKLGLLPYKKLFKVTKIVE